MDILPLHMYELCLKMYVCEYAIFGKIWYIYGYNGLYKQNNELWLP